MDEWLRISEPDMAEEHRKGRRWRWTQWAVPVDDVGVREAGPPEHGTWTRYQTLWMWSPKVRSRNHGTLKEYIEKRLRGEAIGVTSDFSPNPENVRGTESLPFIAFSSDGKRGIAVGHDQTLRVWDLENGKELRKLQGGGDVPNSMEISADGNLALSGGPKVIRVWELSSGRELWSLSRTYVTSASFSPDGKRVAVTGIGGEGAVEVLDAATGKSQLNVKQNLGFVTSLAYSADGSTLAAAGADGQIRLLEAATGKALRTLDVSSGRGLLQTLAFSPDGRTLVGALRGRLIAWSTATGKVVWSAYSGDSLSIGSIAFRPDGGALVTSGNNHIKVWETATGKVLQSLHSTDNLVPGRVAFTGDGKKLLAWGRYESAVRVWQTE